MLRIFKTCTVHKLTHLFASDVVNTEPDALPPDWNLWSSPMSNAFSTMLNDFLSQLLGLKDLPPHAHVIATVSLSNGGLGLQHPRLAAIPSFILSTKRCIDYATNGVFLPHRPSAIHLPPSLRSLFQRWDCPDDDCRTFATFHKYLAPTAAVAIHEDDSLADTITPKDHERFIHSTSLNWARDLLKHHAGEKYLQHLAFIAPNNVIHALPGLLQPHMSLPLVAMSRSNAKHRLDNQRFTFALQSKLRVGIYPRGDAPKCFCGQRIDPDGDHFFSCGDFKKSKCSNDMRDTTWKVMQRICPTAQFCRSKDDVDREKLGLVKDAPTKRPFDWSFTVNSVTSSRLRGSCPLSEIGVDVTVVGPTCPSDLLKNADIEDNSALLLQEGEKSKFARESSASCQKTGKTLTGDQFIGDLFVNDRALIPQAMDRWGQMGPLFRRFLLGDRDAPDPMEYAADRPYARKMNERACSNDVPFGILNIANKQWMESHPSSWYGDSYLEADPKSWALAQLGLGFTNAIVDHILRADARISNTSAKSYYPQRRNATTPVDVDATTPAPAAAPAFLHQQPQTPATQPPEPLTPPTTRCTASPADVVPNDNDTPRPAPTLLMDCSRDEATSLLTRLGLPT